MQILANASDGFDDSISALRSCRAIGPGSPSLMVQSPSWLRTRPTGVTTAAVPQANASVMVPSRHCCRHSSSPIRSSLARNHDARLGARSRLQAGYLLRERQLFEPDSPR